VNSRPATTDDFGAMVELLRADEELLYGRPSQVGVNDLREWMSRTDLAQDSWLYEENGGLHALGWLDREGDGNAAFAIGVVHPSSKGRGLGSALVDRSEARALHYGSTRMHQVTLAPDGVARELLDSRGYSEVRRFYEMAIQLDEAPDVPVLGIETLAPGDFRGFHDALEEAFQDHWEHHGRPFDEWWTRHSANPNIDLSLWFVIR